MKPKIVVAGAGIGGLTASLCLIQRGFDVRVVEQARELGPVGAGIQLSANATRVLYGLGLGPALERVSITPGKKCIRLWNTGQEWQLFDLGRESVRRYGYPYLMLYRPDLHSALVHRLRELQPDALCLGAKVVDVAQEGATATVRLSDGRALRGEGIIGADGVHSVVRARMIVEDQPLFSGCIAWRGVIPVARLPRSMRGNAGVNWVGPGAHVIHYPIHAGELVGFTGIVAKDGWRRESWTETGSVEECLQDFAGWHGDVHALIRQLNQPLRWAMMVREPLTAWTNGCVTLLGDAAHPTLPFLAQGACMAIEDGCVVARALAEEKGDVAAAWKTYQETRIARTTRIVRASAANMQRFHSPQLVDAAAAAAYIDREWEEGEVRSRYEWLFSYQPESVPLVSAAVRPSHAAGDVCH